jgi:predicted extracellular nuclease
MVFNRRLAACAAALTLALFAQPRDYSTLVHASASGLVISQVYGGGGNSGAPFTHDFIEIHNGSSAPISLAGLSLQYTSATGTANFGANAGLRTDLPPLTLAAGRYFLVEAGGGASGVALPTPDHVDSDGPINMSATNGKVALVSGTTSLGCNGGSTPCGAEALARIIDLVGYGNANFFEGDAATPTLSNATAAIRRFPNIDTDDNGDDFEVLGPNPRNSSFVPEPLILQPIHELQGDGETSPSAGRNVLARGIVTARKTNGFFIQTPDGEDDGRPETSEGLFVFTSSVPTVAVGDDVRVSGLLTEFRSSTAARAATLTEITAPTIEHLSSGNAVPSALALASLLPAPGELLFTNRDEQFERYEGMLVTAASMDVVGPTNSFGELQAVISGVPRTFREPGIDVSEALPAEAPATVPRFDSNFERVMLDSGDGRFTVTPANTVDERFPLIVPVGAPGAPVRIQGVFGPLDYAFDNYRVVLDATAVAVGDRQPVPVPARAGAEFTIASLNLENFRDGTPNFEARQQKAARVIVDVLGTPDILGTIEVGDLDDLQNLAGLVNLAAGTSYAAFLEDGDGQTTGFEQNVGYLVDLARINVSATYQAYQGKTFEFAGAIDLLHDRPPLVLEAQVLHTGTPVTVILNHLRSLIDVNSQEPIGTAGLTVGARVREKRRLQTEDVADLIASRISDNLVVLGDMNAFEFNDGLVDVIGTLKGSPAAPDEVTEPSVDRWHYELFDLAESLPAEERYSYLFDGSAQVLDHLLVNAAMRDRLARFTYSRSNSDFPESFESDFSGTTRISDHDAPVAYFAPLADLSVAAGALSPVEAGAAVALQVTVSNGGDTATDVALLAMLPPGLVWQSITQPAGWSCATTGGTVTCGASSVAAGASVTLEVAALVACAVANGTVLTVPVAIESSTRDRDSADNVAVASSVASNTAPTITNVSASRTTLLPLFLLVPIKVNHTAADTCGPVTSTLSVTSDEPVTGRGQGLAGLTFPDWQVIDANRVRLRAERSARGDGRVYTITIRATDVAGGASTAQVHVTVPRHTRRH